jgi:hypothetical protein
MLFKDCGVDSFVQAVRQGTSTQFTDDLRHRLRTVWRDVEGLNPQDTDSKLATYQPLFAVPFYLSNFLMQPSQTVGWKPGSNAQSQLLP